MSRNIPTALLRQVIMRILNGNSDRAIVRDLREINIRISRPSVANIRKQTLPFLNSSQHYFEALNDQQLKDHIYGDCIRADYKPSQAKSAILNRLEYIQEQLKLPGVTLNLLWDELSRELPKEQQCSYSTFCRTLAPHLRITELSYHNEKALPGSVLMFDFAGKRLYYVDKSTGELVGCVVFVAILGNSGYSMVEILPDARTEYVIQALIKCLHTIGGCPMSVLTDNMAQIVKRADRYDPQFTDAALAWANHYNIHLMAARRLSPKDKSLVERLVRIVYQRIYAPLRDLTFFSIEELRAAVAEKLVQHNMHKFSGKSYSRADVFFADEKNALNPLPTKDFVMQRITRAKVQKTYHVYVGEDENYYSVPYTLIGQHVDIKYTIAIVEIYHGDKLVTSHQRSPRPGHYTTKPEHMPEAHRAHKEASGYTTEDFFQKAAIIGPYTLKQVEYLINKREYPQHAYRGCQGLLSLGLLGKYGNERLEAACELGCQIGKYGMTEIKRILSTGQDQVYQKAKKPEKPDGGGSEGSKGSQRGSDDDNNEDEGLRGPEDFVIK